MSHGFELDELVAEEVAASSGRRATGPLAAVQRTMQMLNALITAAGGLALVAACAVLTLGVAMRYVLKFAIDWQDETTIFLIVGAVFLSAAAVQARRGHVAIEAVSALLPPRIERWRLLLVDLLSGVLCCFLTWKSTSQLHDSWTFNEHSISAWGPPMWIPYAFMTAGLALLCLQLALQIVVAIAEGGDPR